MRYKKGKGRILKSITNTRNVKQISLYNDNTISRYKTVSLYLEPIILDRDNSQNPLVWYKIFEKDYEGPLYYEDFFTPTTSTRGWNTYGLQSQYCAYALFVCKGCGYNQGTNGGVTKICFAIGVQKIKNEHPHSGCSLEAYHFFDKEDKEDESKNQIISLSRIALTRSDNKECVIKFKR